MIVCVCKSVSDRHIRGAIQEGLESFEELQFELGVSLCCGKCEGHVRAVLEESGVCASGCLHASVAASNEGVSPIRFYEREAA
jgi:bacterioferritin-associated ferredoxin